MGSNSPAEKNGTDDTSRLDALRALLWNPRKRAVTSAGLTLLLAIAAKPAAAQVGQGEAEQVLCGGDGGVNIGQLVIVALGVLSAIFILVAIFRWMMGANKMGSTQQQKTLEGKEQAKGGGWSVVAAIVPAMAAGIFSAAGIAVAPCVVPGMAAFVPVGLAETAMTVLSATSF